VEVEGVEELPKLKAGFGVSAGALAVAGLAGAPNENPPNGLGFAGGAAGAAGALGGAAGEPKEKPVEAVWPNENVPKGDAAAWHCQSVELHVDLQLEGRWL
jgi:hypothetical protein